MKYETHNPIMNRWRKRIVHRNMNLVMVIIGQTGIGKSWAACRMAEYFDPSFSDNAEERIIFDIKKLIHLINTGRIGKGHVVILDEAGISFGTRDSMTIINKQISYLLQAWRYLNCGLIMTLPDLTFLDLHGRKLCHAVFHAKTLLEKKGVCRGKVYDNINNPWKGETRREFPCTKKSGAIVRHKWMDIGKPTLKVRNTYERMKEVFNQELNTRIEEAIGSLDIEKIDTIARKRNNKRQARKLFKKDIPTKEIAKKLDVTVVTVNRWVKDIRDRT